MHNEIKILKEQHNWASDEKIKWMGYGEWVEEPDLIEFEYKGYFAQICRIFKKEPYASEEAYFGGHLCGYVTIPNDHCFFKDKEKLYDLECHGGITYNEIDEIHKEVGQVHIVGFDCAHLGDYIPTMELIKKNLPELKKNGDIFKIYESSYKNIKYAIESCISIIDNLIDLNKTSLIKDDKV